MSTLNSYAAGYKIGETRRDSKKSLFAKLLTAFLVVFVLSILITFLFSIISFSESDSNFIEHEIQSGESLWSIASQYHGQNVDLRKIIYEIKKINQIDSSVISPGKELLIPLH